MKTSGILLDSDVLAEIRKATPDPRVVAFLRRRAWRHMYISVLSVGELKGLYPYPETDRWIAELLERFADQRDLLLTPKSQPGMGRTQRPNRLPQCGQSRRRTAANCRHRGPDLCQRPSL